MQQAEARKARSVVRVGQLSLARLTQKNDAEELDHGESGQRCHQRDGAGEDRQQHVQVAVRHGRCEQKAL